MGVKRGYNQGSIRETVEMPLVDTSDTKKEHLANDKIEVFPENTKVAKETVLATLEMDKDENLDDFDNKLKEATKSLPKYQEIEMKLSGVDRQNIAHELFKVLKRGSDKETTDENAPKDGVLISSMRQGQLECAGRTLIASTFLQELSIDHVVVFAPGHAFIVIEQSPDTLAYFDANNDLFFTFPKSALEGYQNSGITSKCRLKEYEPRETDFADGINTAFSQFVSMPAREAIGRQYLRNVVAALNGNEEFLNSNIKQDKKASEAVHQMESKIYGDNPVLDNYYQRVETLIELEDMQTEDDRAVLNELFQKYPNRDDFVKTLASYLRGNLGSRIPYMKKASEEQRRVYAENIWVLLQKKRIATTIKGR